MILFVLACVVLFSLCLMDARRVVLLRERTPAALAVAAFASVAIVYGCKSAGEAVVDRISTAPARAACVDGESRCSPSEGHAGVPETCRTDPDTHVSRWLPMTAPSIDGGAPAGCSYCVVDGDGAHCGVAP